MRTQQKQWFIVGGVVVVLLIVLLASKDSTYQPGESPSPTPTPTAAATARPAVKTPAPSAGTPQSYNDALQAYSGRRVQFDAYCQANPSSMALNTGTSIMLDNRSGDPRWVSVAGNAYYLDGYGWKVVSVPSTAGTYYLDCGSAKNVGVLNVQ